LPKLPLKRAGHPASFRLKFPPSAVIRIHVATTARKYKDLAHRTHLLQGETFVPLAQAFEVTRSHPHGHVQAVMLAMIAARHRRAGSEACHHRSAAHHDADRELRRARCVPGRSRLEQPIQE